MQLTTTKTKRKVGVKGSDPLGTVFASLKAYSKSMSQSIEGKQAQNLVSQLATILDVSQKCGNNGPYPVPSSIANQIRHLRLQLKQTNSVKINKARLQGWAPGFTEAHTDIFDVSSEPFKVCLITRILESKNAIEPSATHIHYTLHVQSRGAYQEAHTTAFFFEKIDSNQTTWVHPTILAYNQVDSCSEVFDLVRKDDLEGLQTLLQMGEASWRDCDQEGRTLLMVGCTSYAGTLS